MITTADIARHDQCDRLETWSSEYELPRIPLSEALHESLRQGLISGSSLKAREHMMALGANPGIDVSGWNVFDQITHHAAMMEVVCAYLLGADGPWKCATHLRHPVTFEPSSYLMDDGRLRRVVLCSAWNALREFEERTSWWTVADTCATNRPMLMNVIVIGQSRKGFRPSPWTQGFQHPENGILRVKRIPNEKTGPNPKFSDNWKKVYRESTDEKPEDWLGIMQRDGAFEDLVHSVTAEVPAQRNSILAEMDRIEAAISKKKTTMRRSGCFRFARCPMADLCHHPNALTPEMAGWERKV